MTEETTRTIRFIDSRYNDLFRIPDGGSIQVTLPDRTWTAPCRFIDPYHTQIGGNIYHICEFAELLEKRGGSCKPEPELVGDRFSWMIGTKHRLDMQLQGNEWRYTIWDDHDRFDFGSYVKADGKTPNQARDEILRENRKTERNLYPVPFRERPSVSEQLDAAKSTVSDQPRRQPIPSRTER